MTSKRISVILPALDAESTLLAAASSALKSLGSDDELLILIQSQNPSGYKLHELDDPRVKIFFKQEACGVHRALNYLLAQSTGEYIGRMDADDVCSRVRFNAQLRYLERTNSDFVFSSAVLFGKRARPFGFLPLLPYALSPDQSKLYLAIENPLVHPTMLARRKVMTELGGYRPAVAEDYDLWLRAAAKGYKIRKSARFLLYYRLHENQLTREKTFGLRVSQDPLIAEARKNLRQVLTAEGKLTSIDMDSSEVIQRLRNSSPSLWLIFGPFGNLMSRIGAALLGNRPFWK